MVLKVQWTVVLKFNALELEIHEILEILEYLNVY